MSTSSSSSPASRNASGPNPEIARIEALRESQRLDDERRRLSCADGDESPDWPRRYMRHLLLRGLLDPGAPSPTWGELKPRVDAVRDTRHQLDNELAAEASLLAQYEDDDRQASAGTPLNSRNSDPSRRQDSAKRATKADAIAAERIAVVRLEAQQPLIFRPDTAICGVTPRSINVLSRPGERGATLHGLIGGRGEVFNHVDTYSPDAMDQFALYFDSLRPEEFGSRPTIDHIQHVILAKALTSTGPVQFYTIDSATRQFGHYLAGLGASPHDHDALLFLHSDVTRRKNGTFKIEECLHGVWCRVRRSDGALLINRHQSISARIAQARYDNFAGVNPERIGVSTSYIKEIYAGIEKIKEGTLSADYVDPSSRAIVEHVPLQGPQHLARVALEGPPIPGDATGIWCPKPGYRDCEDVQRLLTYLSMES